MQTWAKNFYKSQAWKRTRDYIFKRDCGLCVRCGAPGEIVHHKIYLTPYNISDESITLSNDNLELLCRNCHAKEHLANDVVSEEFTFDKDGNLIAIPPTFKT